MESAARVGLAERAAAAAQAGLVERLAAAAQAERVAAARAALEGIARVKMLSQVTRKQFGVDLFLRSGIHFGIAVVGEMGHPLHMQQTAIGDAVNIAQRLESAAKDVGVAVFIGNVGIHLGIRIDGMMRIVFSGDVVHGPMPFASRVR